MKIFKVNYKNFITKNSILPVELVFYLKLVIFKPKTDTLLCRVAKNCYFATVIKHLILYIKSFNAMIKFTGYLIKLRKVTMLL